MITEQVLPRKTIEGFDDYNPLVSNLDCRIIMNTGLNSTEMGQGQLNFGIKRFIKDGKVACFALHHSNQFAEHLKILGLEYKTKSIENDRVLIVFSKVENCKSLDN